MAIQATQGTYTPANLPTPGSNPTAEQITTDFNGLIQQFNLPIGQSKMTITGAVTMGSGSSLSGSFGSVGGEYPAIAVRNTSASNKSAAVTIYYQFPFTAAPTVTVTLLQALNDGSNTNLMGSTTTATVNLTDNSSNYVGFIANFTNNANFTANTHVTVAFTWSATL